MKHSRYSRYTTKPWQKCFFHVNQDSGISQVHVVHFCHFHLRSKALWNSETVSYIIHEDTREFISRFPQIFTFWGHWCHFKLNLCTYPLEEIVIFFSLLFLIKTIHVYSHVKQTCRKFNCDMNEISNNTHNFFLWFSYLFFVVVAFMQCLCVDLTRKRET